MPKKKVEVIEEKCENYFKERNEWTKKNKKEVFGPTYDADIQEVVEERNMTEKEDNNDIKQAIIAINKLVEKIDLDKFSKSFAKNIFNVQSEYSKITETTGETKRNKLKNKLSWGLVKLIRMEGK